MYSLPKNVYRERIDFSKIKTTVPIPNLIEIQKKSYERFLQMNRLPSEREDAGLQSVFKSVFPISDFRENSSLEFIEYSIGNWECKCARLQGLHHLRQPCTSCGHTLIADPYGEHEVLCPRCGKPNDARGDICDVCGNTVGLKLKYDVDECQERGMTYAVPLKVTIRLVVWNKDPETGVKTIRDIKEQEVYYGDIPLMTDNGTFIINGTERVIVSQLHRSPGAFFHSEDKTLYIAQIIPYRGSWVEFEYDAKNLLYVRIDRKRKFLATVFLRALGLRGADEIIRSFYTVDRLMFKNGVMSWAVGDSLLGLRASKDIKAGGETVTAAGRKINATAIAALKKANVATVEIADAELEGAFAAGDVVDPETGEVILEANEPLEPRVISMAQEKNVEKIEIFFPEKDETGNVLSATLKKDPIHTHEEALIEIYRRLRPGDPPTLDSSRNLFESMFFNPQKYDFSRVGRLKLNTKLKLSTPLDEKILHPQDFYEVIKYLLKLRRYPANVDDIDHLGNRRVRSVGELLENQFRIGLVRMERAIKEKMSVYQEMATAMPHDLINAKPVMAAIREFFGSSQLSQFMDQTNPLSEVTHKRRLSALGPGGLSRERAGFEVRDVHPTHYGRICPIETPEGPNIGLISSLSCYARINEFGFIESPYRKVKDGRVVDYVIITNAGGNTKYKVGDIVEAGDVGADKDKAGEPGAGGRRRRGLEYEPYSYYLSAWEEDQYIIAQANAKVADNGKFLNDRVNCRQAGNFILAERSKVDFIDVSPKQLVSVAASLIPFLENDDANRALMGSNMQRQAVPLLRARAPYVGTGMEYITARDSGACIVARRSGTVDYVDSQRIVVRVEGENESMSREMGADIYPMTKFKRSNQNTCINQKPIVRVEQKVHKGQILADGPCTELGELALGRNVLVAFMPWRGYNFEDAILISERMVKDDAYTSIHIEEFEIEARDTKLGPEEITRDIPNVGEGYLADLDESGIIRIGAAVKPGDILVGKVTPKGETQLTPEEKLLRAIFGEKAGDVRDASLVCPPGIEGIIVGVKIFSRKGIEKDDRAKAIENDELEMMEKNLQDEIRILHDEVKKRVIVMLRGQESRADLYDEHGRERLLKKGTALTEDVLQNLPYEAIVRLKVNCRRSAARGGPARARGAHRAPGRSHPEPVRGEEREGPPRRRAAARGHQAGEGLRRDEAQAVGRRQDGRPPRQQGRHRAHPAGRRHAVSARRHAGGNRAEPARRSVAHERRPDSRDPSRVGRARARSLLRHARLRRRDGKGDQALARGGRTAQERQDRALRRHERDAVRAGRDGRLHLHAEAVAPGRRQDPRALDRAVLAHHPAAAGRQGAVRRTAVRRDGGLGARGVRRRAHPPGAAHREVRRRDRPREDLRGDRQGRRVVPAGAAGIVQRPHPRAAGALPRRRADEDEEEVGGARGPHDRRRGARAR